MATEFATAAMVMAAAAVSAAFTIGIVLKRRIAALERAVQALRAERGGG